jgi:hypothetical protein
VKFDEPAIALGIKLNRLIAHPDFGPFLEELEGQIEKKRDFILEYRAQADSTQVILPTFQAEYRALKDLREWIDDGIERGAAELRRKQEAEIREQRAEAKL